VEPIEMPIGERSDEIVDVAWTIPVARLVAARLDLRDPVHQLSPLSIDIVANRINNHLAGREPSCADHARARQYRRPDRDAAPHLDARIERGAFVRTARLADDRANADA